MKAEITEVINARQYVQTQITDLCKKDLLNLPKSYSVGNALMTAQLAIQDKPELLECSKASLQKSMLDMCIMGLNISKQQCYIIPYGRVATLEPSYEGYKLMAMRVDPSIEDIFARVVTKGEEFDFENLPNGYANITCHKSTLESLEIKNPLEDIVGAYATIIRKSGEHLSLVMPLSEILKRWRKSKMRPFNNDGTLRPDSVHAQFPDKMACRTVINAICRPIIRSSDDSDLFIRTLQAHELDSTATNANADATSNMCEGKTIDIDVDDYTEIDNVATEEVNSDSETQETEQSEN